jgi:hypothetical protein
VAVEGPRQHRPIAEVQDTDGGDGTRAVGQHGTGIGTAGKVVRAIGARQPMHRAEGHGQDERHLTGAAVIHLMAVYGYIHASTDEQRRQITDLTW